MKMKSLAQRLREKMLRQRNAQILKDYLSGNTVKSIAENNDMKIRNVFLILENMRLVKPGLKRKTDIRRKKENLARNRHMLRMKNAGRSASDIGAAFGISRTSVLRILRNMKGRKHD